MKASGLGVPSSTGRLRRGPLWHETSAPANRTQRRRGLSATLDARRTSALQGRTLGVDLCGRATRRARRGCHSIWNIETAMSLSPTARDWKLARQDFDRGFRSWNVWVLLGLSDIRQRYKRSRFGQFWITFSMAIFIAGIGAVYSTLFHQPIREYIPYIAANITVWTLISGVANDSALAFTASAVFLRQDPLPKTVFVLRVMVRQVITFAHNLIILPLVYLVLLVMPSPYMVFAIPGLCLDLVALFFIGLFLGVLSTRFRDLPPIILNAMQLLFFVTPVMWRSDQLGKETEAVLALNPFAAMLRLVSDPFQGIVPPAGVYASVVLFVVVMIALSVPLFARFRARIVYWL